MTEYIYHAVDSKGQAIDGTMAADSEQNLDIQLQQLGYWLIDAAKKQGKKDLIKVRTSRRDLIDFFSALSSLLAAGVGISKTLDAIVGETTDEGFAIVINDMKINVEAGISLDVAMAKHPQIFSSQIINLIKAGDYSGNLATACDDISRHLEWLDKIMSEVKQASIYPVTVLLAVMGLVFLMFSFVVPQFNKIFISLHLKLPALTRAVVDMGEFSTRYWWLLLSIPVAITVFLKYGPVWSLKIKIKLDQLKLDIPVFGHLNRMILQSRFCHNMALLLKAGVPILESLSLCKALMGNWQMQTAVAEAEAAVNEGQRMSEALRKHRIISPVVLRMLVVGEETGELDKMLECASLRFDKEIPRQIKYIFNLVEPVVMFSLISNVGLIGGAIFMPMFGLISGIGN